MSFLDRFRKKEEKKQLEERAAKASGSLELAEKVKKPGRKKTAVTAAVTKKGELRKIPIGKTEEKKSVKKIYKPKFQISHDILVKPLITEKISGMASMGKYAFLVSPDANKLSVKKAVGAVYGVSVSDVRIINVVGKKVRYGRSFGQRKDWKKAIVTLAPGEKIEVYEGV